MWEGEVVGVGRGGGGGGKGRWWGWEGEVVGVGRGGGGGGKGRWWGWEGEVVGVGRGGGGGGKGRWWVEEGMEGIRYSGTIDASTQYLTRIFLSIRWASGKRLNTSENTWYMSDEYLRTVKEAHTMSCKRVWHVRETTGMCREERSHGPWHV